MMEIEVNFPELCDLKNIEDLKKKQAQLNEELDLIENQVMEELSRQTSTFLTSTNVIQELDYSLVEIQSRLSFITQLVQKYFDEFEEKRAQLYQLIEEQKVLAYRQEFIEHTRAFVNLKNTVKNDVESNKTAQASIEIRKLETEIEPLALKSKAYHKLLVNLKEFTASGMNYS